MNWDRVEGQWKQMSGKVKAKWGKLTDDDLTVIAGKKDQLVGRIQERYGIHKDEAEKQVDQWNTTLADDNAELERQNERKGQLGGVGELSARKKHREALAEARAFLMGRYTGSAGGGRSPLLTSL